MCGHSNFLCYGRRVWIDLELTFQHDGLTKAGGWFLDQVEIVKRIPKTGKEKSWIFACSQWLSLHMGDCQISRELHAKHYSSTGGCLVQHGPRWSQRSIYLARTRPHFYMVFLSSLLNKIFREILQISLLRMTRGGGVIFF